LKKNQHLKILIILFLVVLLIFIAGLAGRGITLFDVADLLFIRPASNIVSHINKTKAQIHKLSSLTKTKLQLEKENTKLKKEISILEERIKLIQGIYEENERLKNILGLKERYGFKYKVGTVVSILTDNFNTIIINRGERDGIKINMPVVCTYDGKTINLVGIVIDTSSNFSKVQIVTDPDFYVGAKDMQTGEISIAQGNGKNLSIIIKISLPKMQNGDLITTTGVSDIYPENIIIGKISNIKKKSSFTTEIIISPYVDFNTLYEVMVIYEK